MLPAAKLQQDLLKSAITCLCMAYAGVCLLPSQLLVYQVGLRELAASSEGVATIGPAGLPVSLRCDGRTAPMSNW